MVAEKFGELCTRKQQKIVVNISEGDVKVGGFSFHFSLNPQFLTKGYNGSILKCLPFGELFDEYLRVIDEVVEGLVDFGAHLIVHTDLLE